jgi:hypothetical protein
LAGTRQRRQKHRQNQGNLHDERNHTGSGKPTPRNFIRHITQDVISRYGTREIPPMRASAPSRLRIPPMRADSAHANQCAVPAPDSTHASRVRFVRILPFWPHLVSPKWQETDRFATAANRETPALPA